MVILTKGKHTEVFFDEADFQNEIFRAVVNYMKSIPNYRYVPSSKKWYLPNEPEINDILKKFQELSDVTPPKISVKVKGNYYGRQWKRNTPYKLP